MTNALIHIFIRDAENTGDSRVREKFGVLSGAVGLACNLFLFALKLIMVVPVGVGMRMDRNMVTTNTTAAIKPIITMSYSENAFFLDSIINPPDLICFIYHTANMVCRKWSVRIYFTGSDG